MLIRRAFFLVLALAALPLVAQAQQAKLPGFEVTGTVNPIVNEEKIDTSAEAAFGTIKNDDMRSILRLQNQIMMIQALTNWQAQVTKLQETYNKAGLPFTSPKPPRVICDEIPANSVCADAYGDAPQMETAKGPAMPEPEPIKTEKPAAKKSAPAKPAKPKAPQYRWADIRCMANACSAVLINTDTGARVSAIEGETLDDNVLVQRITPQGGVTLIVNGAATELLPSDSSGTGTGTAQQRAPAPAQTAPDREGLSRALATIPQGAGDNPTPVAGSPIPETEDQAIVLDDGEGNVDQSPVTAPEPMTTTTTAPAGSSGGGLGPTGLF